MDARTEIRSLGVILYETIAYRLPFPGETSSDRLAAILEREPEPITNSRRGVPLELGQIVTRALTKNKDNRYQTMTDLTAALHGLRGTLDAVKPTRFTLPPPSPRPAFSRATRLIVLALVVGIIGIITAGFFVFRARRGVEGSALRQHLEPMLNGKPLAFQ